MPTHSTSATHPSQTRSSRPPRLALVVGGSDLRSAAALGVAEVLAREGLRPDVIVGSGAGALFGATVAVGMPVEHALRTAAEVWSPKLSRRPHWRAWLQLVAPRLPGIGANLALRDARAIEQRLRDAFGQRRLEDGPALLRVDYLDTSPEPRPRNEYFWIAPAFDDVELDPGADAEAALDAIVALVEAKFDED